MDNYKDSYLDLKAKIIQRGSAGSFSNLIGDLEQNPISIDNSTIALTIVKNAQTAISKAQANSRRKLGRSRLPAMY